MSAIRLSAATALALAAVVSACAPMPAAGPVGPATTVFRAEDFAWSARGGQAAINGTIEYRETGRAFACTGSVGLTPETPYTRQRFLTLYGTTDRAAVPEAVVRARTVADPNADYRAYVRSTTCTGGRFSFTGLPDGGWFIIVPVSADGAERVVLMRRVETRGGRAISVGL